MHVSRLTFQTTPGKTHEIERELQKLLTMVGQVDGGRPRVLRNHFTSLSAPDVVFEQEAPDSETLETQIVQVTQRAEFQQRSGHMSELPAQSPKREVYHVV
jgi:hypothetical protein